MALACMRSAACSKGRKHGKSSTGLCALFTRLAMSAECLPRRAQVYNQIYNRMLLAFNGGSLTPRGANTET